MFLLTWKTETICARARVKIHRVHQNALQRNPSFLLIKSLKGPVSCRCKEAAFQCDLAKRTTSVCLLLQGQAVGYRENRDLEQGSGTVACGPVLAQRPFTCSPLVVYL